LNTVQSSNPGIGVPVGAAVFVGLEVGVGDEAGIDEGIFEGISVGTAGAAGELQATSKEIPVRSNKLRIFSPRKTINKSWISVV